MTMDPPRRAWVSPGHLRSARPLVPVLCRAQARRPLPMVSALRASFLLATADSPVLRSKEQHRYTEKAKCKESEKRQIPQEGAHIRHAVHRLAQPVHPIDQRHGVRHPMPEERLRSVGGKGACGRLFIQMPVLLMVAVVLLRFIAGLADRHTRGPWIAGSALCPGTAFAGPRALLGSATRFAACDDNVWRPAFAPRRK